jgi:hypothetical protein
VLDLLKFNIFTYTILRQNPSEQWTDPKVLKDGKVKAGNVVAKVTVGGRGWKKSVKEGECDWGTLYACWIWNMETC